jgi:hypothetical protein
MRGKYQPEILGSMEHEDLVGDRSDHFAAFSQNNRELRIRSERSIIEKALDVIPRIFKI